jgi:hypothetical protein
MTRRLTTHQNHCHVRAVAAAGEKQAGRCRDLSHGKTEIGGLQSDLKRPGEAVPTDDISLP